MAVSSYSRSNLSIDPQRPKERGRFRSDKQCMLRVKKRRDQALVLQSLKYEIYDISSYSSNCDGTKDTVLPMGKVTMSLGQAVTTSSK